MRLVVHIILTFCILTACPLEGNSQCLPAKIAKSLKSVSRVSSTPIRRIPVGGHITTPPIIQSATKLPVPMIMVDTTIFERMKQHNRMSEIIKRKVIVLPSLSIDIPHCAQ